MHTIPKHIVALATNDLVAKLAERRRLIAPLDQQIFEAAAFLREHGEPVPAEVDAIMTKAVGADSADADDAGAAEGWAAARAIRKNIERHAEALLADGKTMSTEDIFAALTVANVPINTDNKKRRLLTILSDSQRFAHVRGEGWRLVWPQHGQKSSAPEESTSKGAE